MRPTAARCPFERGFARRHFGKDGVALTGHSRCFRQEFVLFVGHGNLPFPDVQRCSVLPAYSRISECVGTMKLTPSQVIELLKGLRGARPAKALADELGFSAPDLCEIYKGTRNPGPSVLEKLGLWREAVDSIAR